MNDTAGAVSKKSDGPGDDQDYCDDVKEISHDCNFYVIKIVRFINSFQLNQFRFFD
jgi:hypothetical protein